MGEPLTQPSAAGSEAILGGWPASLKLEQAWHLQAASFVQAFQLPSSCLQARLLYLFLACHARAGSPLMFLPLHACCTVAGLMHQRTVGQCECVPVH